MDLVGKQFGRLTVTRLSAERTKAGQPKWECLCSCGATRLVIQGDLKSGHTTSCGCSRKTHNMASRVNGHSRIYRIWKAMRARCSKENNTYFHVYGGRGISVCPQWRYSFEAFFAWAASVGYKDDLTLDRIDNDGNYAPENCRWVTIQVNAQNAGRTKLNAVAVKAIRVAKAAGIMTQKEMAKFFGVDPSTISNAIRGVNWSNI